MEDKKIFDEVNEKIIRIQQQFSIRMNWDRNDANTKNEFIEVSTENWSDGGEYAKGVKIKAIEQLTSDMPSDSVIFYAPKGAIIESHSHPQMQFCICLSGKVKFTTINNGHNVLKPIESVYLKPHELHLVEFLEESQLIVCWFPKFK